MIVGLPRLIIIAVLGAIIAVVIGAIKGTPFPWKTGKTVKTYPALYRLPKVPGGTPLRLAMVHDVIHERFLRHGAAWYENRNRRCLAIIERSEAAIAQGRDPDPGYAGALDDLAVGLERLGDPANAIPVMRRKLAYFPAVQSEAPATASVVAVEQSERSGMAAEDVMEILAIAGTHLSEESERRYTGWANLGTVLIHNAMARAIKGDPEAQKDVREGLDALRTAMRINPSAHFGRETWQAIAVEHLLGAMKDPEIIAVFTLIGDPLEDADPPTPGTLYRSHGMSSWWQKLSADERKIVPDIRAELRSDVRRVGVAKEWREAVAAEERFPKPFDEPTLGLIGMWTLGGGANPHSALALGRIMEQIGERHIAWTAYERALSLRERWWPDPAIVERLAEYCHSRQRAIAKALAGEDAQAWEEKMRSTHVAELAWGQAYQREYAEFEKAELEAGRDLDAPGAYDAFFKGRPPIATAPRGEDDVAVESRPQLSGADTVILALVGAAIGSVLAALSDARSRRRALDG